MKRLFIAVFLLLTAATNAHPAHFVLVHGSWHGAWCWYKLETLLEQQGHRVTAIDLPAHGIDTTAAEDVTLQDYENTIVSTIDALDTSEQIILVGHSMGGIAVSSAAAARPQSIDKIIYLAAFMLDDGQSMMEISSQDENSLINSSTLIPTFNGSALDIDRNWIEEIFYTESDQFDVTLAEALLVLEPSLPVIEELSLDSSDYWSIPRYYIKTMQDNAISPEIQQMMIDRIGVNAVYPIYTDHSPFFSRPYHLLAILNEISSR
jgi:pimeloyl-ACP methyl ester carboxylesterase